jgi:micrococcal nuclease
VGNVVRFRREAARWRRHAGAGGFEPAQLRIMLWSGLLAGLLAFEVSQPGPAWDQWLLAAPTADSAIKGASPLFVRVIDGDTFDYAGTRIRIADIDTPEVHGRCPYETALAARATARTRQLLAAGAFELQPLPSGRDEDRYGRKLRIVTRGGRSLGDALVAEGLARTWTGRREPWCN